MTVFQARMLGHLNLDGDPNATVSVYSGPDSETLRFAGHLTLPAHEAEAFMDYMSVGHSLLGPVD